MDNGELHLWLGPMFASKSKSILSELDRYSYGEKRCVYVCHSLDATRGNGYVYTHNGNFGDLTITFADEEQTELSPGSHRYDRIYASNIASIMTKLVSYDVIAIDEGQFFDDIELVLTLVEIHEKCVLIASLDGDFNRNPIGGVLDLIPKANTVTKLSAVCTTCKIFGRIAHNAPFTFKKSGSKDVVDIGAKEKYAAVCRTCYNRLQLVREHKGDECDINELLPHLKTIVYQLESA